MDPFTSDYLANLTADLSARILESTGRRLREALLGTEKQQALERCLQAGVVALLATAATAVPEKMGLLAGVFNYFLRNSDVGKELGALLRGNPLDMAELAYLFEQAGYDAGNFPGLDFQKGMAAFEVAFLTAATDEPALQGTLQTGQLLAQTRLQRELVAAMRELVDFLRQARPNSLGIQASQITAQNVVDGAQIVYQLPRVAFAPLPGDWEGHYLRTLISQCDPLDLSPIDETHPQGSRLGEASTVRVSDVFTFLNLDRLTRTPKQTVADAIRRRHAPGVAMPKAREEERIPIQAVEAVAALPRVVILGQPGGGKSTLVNYIATQLARRRLDQAIANEKLPVWPAEEKPLPVRIILRRFAAWLPASASRGAAGMVWDYLEHQLQQGGCKEAFGPLKRVLTEEGGVIFFDGLDEVRETDEAAKRSLIKAAIAEFAAPLDKCRVVVTCREYAYKEKDAWRLPVADFPVVELALFDLDQVKFFTQTWYRVVGPPKGWDQAKCDREADNLFQAIKGWPHLRRLAQYPLLLTLMAQVHGRDGTLPKDRADLYERAANLLLAHWENRIVRDVDGGPRVEPGLVMQLGIRTETLRAALERVAFAAHERQEREQDRSERAADIPKEDLLEELRSDLGSLDKAEQVTFYIQDRAGLLQARDNRTYAFAHRTFQEYLAATYLLKQAEFDQMLRDRVRRDPIWWREVFLLAAGASRSTPRNISDLVDCLLPKAPNGSAVSAEKAVQAQVAAQALDETDFAEHVRKEQAVEAGRFSETYGRVQQWLIAAMRADATLPPKDRAAAGDALARLGDPRFRPDAWYLPNEPLLGFVKIPAGPFLMGEGEEQHELVLPEYYIARYPVTVAQFKAFVDDSGHKPDDPVSLQGLPNHPVVSVTWYDAIAYCKWLTKRWREWDDTPEPLATLLHTGANGGPAWRVTLPSEAEWEKAARGTDGRVYPWGDKADPNRANYGETGIRDTSAVGCFPGGASPYGVEDLSGNVWEWTRSLSGDYPYPVDEKKRRQRENLEAGRDAHRVLRGGAFFNDGWVVRCAVRYGYYPNLRNRNFGFRVVVSPL